MLIRKFFFIISSKKGFTLIEVLVSILILIIGVLAILTLQARFATSTADRAIRNALVDAAASAIAHCESMRQDPPSSYNYGGITVNVSRTSGVCSPTKGSCNNVTVVATARGKSFNLTSKICHFD